MKQANAQRTCTQKNAHAHRKKISSSFQNILERLNVGDESNVITEDLLEEIVAYATKCQYICTSSYKNNISYRINEKDIEFECIVCGEKLSPYTENFLKRTVEYVDRETFESLANEIYDLKTDILQIKNKSSLSSVSEDSDINYRDDLINNLKGEISSLSKQISDKDNQILFLMKYISQNTTNVNTPVSTTNNVSMATDNTTHRDNNSINWQLVDNRSHVIQRNTSNKTTNDVPLYNRFNGLINEETYSLENNSHINDQGIDFTKTTTNASKSFNFNKRPNIVINKHHANDVLLSQDNVVKRTFPGNSTYADISKNGKKYVCYSRVIDYTENKNESF